MKEFRRYLYDQYLENKESENSTSLVTLDQIYDLIVNSWLPVYRGDVAEWKEYRIPTVNGIGEETKRLLLNMGKKVCEDIANLEMNERIEISFENDEAKEYVDEVLRANNFWVRQNQLVEMAQGLGTAANVEYVEPDESKVKRRMFRKNTLGIKIVIDYIRADMIFPYKTIGGEVVDCAFISVSKRKDRDIAYVTEFMLEAEGYVITNKRLSRRTSGTMEEKNVTEITPDENGKFADGTEAVVYTNSAIPPFQITKPNVVNTIDFDIGLGLSRFAKSIDLIKVIDLIFDSYANEFTTGKKRIFVDNKLAKLEVTDSDGGDLKISSKFDKNDSVFYEIDMKDATDKIKLIDPELRTTEHDEGLNMMLNLLSNNCGLGEGYYRNDKGTLKTATEIISSNSALFRSIKKDELILERSLVGTCRSILSLANQYDGKKFDVSQEIKVNFDDSIFEDAKAMRDQALIEFGAGLLDKVGYYMKADKMTEEEATKYVNERAGGNNAVEDEEEGEF